MSNEKLHAIFSASLKSGVAILPLAIAFAQMPAYAQGAAPATAAKKTQAELDAEAAAAKAVAEAGDPAAADDAKAAAAAGAVTGKDIVVTGTSIRGVAPTGTNQITITTQDVAATGANRGQEVLASLPQIGGNFFNGIPQSESINQTAAGGVNQSTNKPTLRPTPTGGGSNETGNSTLILVDGNRQSGIGVNGSSANPDAVPPALLERVEVNTDGGSSIYGSDAIGGVINFVTRKTFDGIQVGGHVGFGDAYKKYDGNIIAGTTWGKASGAYIAYSYAHNDPLFNRDRSFVNPIDWGTLLQTGLNCDLPNARINAAATANAVTPVEALTHYYAVSAAGVPGTTSFTVVAPVTGTPNLCSLGLNATLASANTQHNAMANITQELTDSLKLTVRGRYAKDRQHGILTPMTYTGTVAQSILVSGAAVAVNNPYFRALGTTAPDNAVLTYSVLGNFRPAFGDQRVYSNGSTQYGGITELTWDIDHNWQFRGTANYDHSVSTYSNATYNATAINNGFNGTATTPCSVQHTTATCFNPFNIAASDPALLAAVTNWQDIGRGVDKILNLKGIVDGALFELPGGKVRMAVGVEYLKDQNKKGTSPGALPGTAISYFAVTQTVKSAFGELNIPLFSSANGRPLLRELRLSASGRYDKYSGLSGVFNPRFGASYKPFDWLTFRGNWGRAFRAPTTVDLLGTSKINTTISPFPATVFNSFLIDPARPIVAPQTSANALALVLLGTQPTVGPQKGINWSAGAEITPFKGFRASVSYFSIDYIGTLGNPAGGTPVFPSSAAFITVCPPQSAGGCTQAQIDAIASLANSSSAIASVDRTLVYGLYDLRRRNLGNTKVGGIDYSVRYTLKTGFGSVYANAAGNILLERREQSDPTAPFVNALAVNPSGAIVGFSGSKHKVTVQAGFTWGGLRGQFTLNRNDGYRVTLIPNSVFQSRVKAFNLISTFWTYDFPGEDILQRNLQLSLKIDNLFDIAPPEYRANGTNGYANGSTLGRIFTFGIQKKF